MHPLLVRLSLAQSGIPLLPALLALTLVGLTVVVLGVMTRQRSLFLLGSALSVMTLAFAIRFRGQTLVPGPVLVSSFGALCSLSLGVGWVAVMRGARARGMDGERVGWVLFASLAGALVGARLLYVAMSPDFGLADALALSHGGLSAAGAFLGGLLCLALSAPRFTLSALAVLDLAAPALAFAVTALRLGCLLQGCDYGPALGSSAPRLLRSLGTLERWPVAFELGAGPPALLTQVARGIVAPDASHSVAAHPTPLYEAFVGLTLLGYALWLSKRQRFEGQIGLSVVAGYALFTAALSPLLVDPERGRLTPWLFVALGLAAAGAWMTLARKARVYSETRMH